MGAGCLFHFSVLRTRAVLRRLFLDAVTALVMTVAVESAVHAGSLPQGPQVVTGTVQVQSASPTTLNINQSTDRAAINWQSFSISQGNTVNIQQPNARSIQLDQVVGNNVSQIFGDLNSNGRVILANPSGVWFGPNAQVNVSGIVATTSTASSSDIAAFGAGGNLNLSQPGKANASVVNQGTVTVSQAGLTAFVAPTVANNGMITAKLGTVQLSSGTAPTLDFYGDGLISLAVMGQVATAPGAPVTGSVQNTGTISASGGTVTLSANVAAGVVNQVINNSGVIEAKAVGQQPGGQIVLNGGPNGTVTVSGTLDASGLGAGQTGGTVKVLGNAVQLTHTAKINVSGAAGGGTVLVGGNFHGAGPDPNAATVTVVQGASIEADALVSGNGGNVVVWSNDNTSFDGTITAMGGLRGKGGSVETSGAELNVGNDATVNTTAPQGTTGTWLLDPLNLYVTSNGSPPGGDSNASAIKNTTLQNALGSSNVTLQTTPTTATCTGGCTTNGTASSGQAGNITIDATVNWTSTHTLFLTSYNNIVVNDAITGTNGTLVLSSGGSVTQSAAISVSALDLLGTGAGYTLTNAGNSFGTVAANTGSVSLTNSIGLSIGTVNGTNGVTASGNVTFELTTGSLTQSQPVTVTGTSSFTTDATHADITLNTSTNELTGAVTLDTTGSTGNASLKNGKATTLAASNVGGNLTVEDTVGNLTQSGAVTVGGTSSFTTDATNADITLNTSTNELTGAVTLDTTGTTGNANLLNGKATTLAASNVGGNLAVEDTVGNLTQSGAVTVGGTSSFKTDQSSATIALNGSNDFSGAVTLTTTGNGNASLTNDDDLLLGNANVGTGTLTLTDAVNNVTQGNGTSITAGSLLLLGSGGDYTVTNTGNSIGTVAANTGSVSLYDSTDLAVGTISGTAGIRAPGNNSGDVTLQSAGSITINASSPITVGRNDTVTLVAANNFINNEGNGAISVGTGGNWLIYSNAPGTDQFGPGASSTFLNSGNTAVWDTTYPTAVSVSGDRYVFAFQPTATITPTILTKTYGRNYTTNVANDTYTVTGAQAGVTGAYLGDSNGSIVSGTPTFASLGAPATADVTGSPYAITETGLTSPNGYAIVVSASSTLTVTPAALTVTPDAVSVTYNGVALNNATYSDTLTNYSISGYQNGQNATSAGISLSGSMAFNNSTTTSVLNTGTYSQKVGTLALSSNNSNYSLNFSNLTPNNYIITPAALTVTPDAVSVTYNGVALNNATYSDTLTNYSISGYQNGQNATSAGISLSGSMAFNNSTTTSVLNTGTYSQKVGTLALSSNNSNYSLNFSNLTPNNYIITPAALTVTPDAVSVTYNGVALNNAPYSDTLTNYSISGYQNGQNATSAGISLSGSMAFNGSPTTTVLNASVYSLDQGTLGLTSGHNNYVMSFSNPNPNSYIINPAALTITANDESKTYNGNPFPFTGTEFTQNGLVNGETIATVTLTTSPANPAIDAGSYTIRPSNPVAGTGTGGTTFLASNYNITFDPGTLTINPAALTITADNQNKTYGNTFTFAGTEFTTNGLVSGDTVTSATIASAGAAPTATVVAPGPTYPIDISAALGSGLGNYNITYVPGTLTINPAALTVTANDQSKTYGDTFTFVGTEFTTNGLVTANGDSVTSATITSTGAASTATVVAPGPTYPIEISAALGTGLGNYNITYVPGTMTINPAALTITANDESKTYDTNPFPFTGIEFTSNGLVNGETIASVTLTTSPDNPAINAGSYAITPSNPVGGSVFKPLFAPLVPTPVSSFNPGNYNITYVNGTLTINPATLTVVPNNTTATYTGVALNNGAYSDNVANYAITGFQGADTLASSNIALTGSMAFNGSPTTTVLNASVYSLDQGTLGLTSGHNNYVMSFSNPNPNSYIINPAALTITANDESKTYNGNPFPFTGTEFTQNGLVNGETIATVTLTTSPANPAIDAGSYTIRPSNPVAGTGTGGTTFLASNYNITFDPGTLTINPAALTITADNQNKTYGNTFTFAGTEFTTNGLVSGDTVTSATIASAGAAPTATVVAPGPTYPIDISAALGSGLGNYNITYVPGTLTINPAALTVTANDQSKTYGNTFTFVGTEFTTNGLVTANGNSVTSATITSTGAASTATVVSPGPTYAINIASAVGSGLGNYAITYVPGTMTVNPAALAVISDNASKTYGDTFTFVGTEFTTNGLVTANGNSVTSATITSAGAAATATVVAPGPTYAIDITAAQGSGLGNYTITYVPGTMTVNPKTLAISADDVFKLFGTTFTFAGTEFTTSPRWPIPIRLPRPR